MIINFTNAAEKLAHKNTTVNTSNEVLNTSKEKTFKRSNTIESNITINKNDKLQAEKTLKIGVDPYASTVTIENGVLTFVNPKGVTFVDHDGKIMIKDNPWEVKKNW